MVKKKKNLLIKFESTWKFVDLTRRVSEKPFDWVYTYFIFNRLLLIILFVIVMSLIEINLTNQCLDNTTNQGAAKSKSSIEITIYIVWICCYAKKNIVTDRFENRHILHFLFWKRCELYRDDNESNVMLPYDWLSEEEAMEITFERTWKTMHRNRLCVKRDSRNLKTKLNVHYFVQWRSDWHHQMSERVIWCVAERKKKQTLSKLGMYLTFADKW